MRLRSRTAGRCGLMGGLLLLASVIGAAAEPGQPAATRLSALAAQALGKPFEAGFRQSKRVALLREPLESRGRVRLDLPEFVRWEVVEPEPFVIESRAGELRMGLPGDLRVVSGNSSRLGASFPLALREIFGADPDRLAAAFEVVARPGEAAFGLRPRDAEVSAILESIELELDPASGVLSRVELRQPGGDRTEIQFFSDAER